MTEANGETISLSKDPTLLILDARDKVVFDAELDPGARLLFVALLDLAVRNTSKRQFGIVTASDNWLCNKLGVSRRTIQRWKKQLVEARVIRVNHQPMPNTWPISTFVISHLVSAPITSEKTSPAGLWGNGRRCLEQMTWSREVSCAAGGAGAKEGPQNEKPSTLLEMTPGKRHGRRLSGVTGDAGQASQVTPGKRHQRRRSSVTSGAGQASPVTPGKRHQRRRASVTGDAGQAPSAALLKKSKVGAEGQSNQGERAAQSAAPPPVQRDPVVLAWEEKAFKQWEARLDTMFPSQLERLAQRFREELKKGLPPGDEAAIRRKLEAVLLRLEGPGAKVPRPKPKIETTKERKALPPPLFKEKAAETLAAMKAALSGLGGA